jgi:hypothetical protein
MFEIGQYVFDGVQYGRSGGFETLGPIAQEAFVLIGRGAAVRGFAHTEMTGPGFPGPANIMWRGAA